MGTTRNAQAIRKKGEERMTTETQGIPKNPMNNQAENKEALLRIMTGALSVLSFGRERIRLPLPARTFPPTIFSCKHSSENANFNLLHVS
jgi:hypothetical protein